MTDITGDLTALEESRKDVKTVWHQTINRRHCHHHTPHAPIHRRTGRVEGVLVCFLKPASNKPRLRSDMSIIKNLFGIHPARRNNRLPTISN